MPSNAARRIKSISYARYGYYFILPFFIVYILFQLWPLIQTFIIAFYGNSDPTAIATGGSRNPAKSYTDEFIGLQNITDLLFNSDNTLIDRNRSSTSTAFWTALGNTCVLWFGNFIPQILLSLLLAVWFTDSKIKIAGKGFFKVVMYLPNIITAASVAALFKVLLNDADGFPGPINMVLMDIAGKDVALDRPFSFIQNISDLQPWLPRASVMFIQTWLWFGNTMLMLMSGIMGINGSLFEAADIDGASSFQVFRHITLPLLRPIMLYTLVTSMIGGLQMFDIPLLYRSGAAISNVNPNLKTIAIFIYQKFNGDKASIALGFAGAASVILFVITSVLGAIAFYINRDKDAIAKKKQIKRLIQQQKIKQQKSTLGGYSGL
ncbi:MAG: sugar ABC transporter permease [Oscillospiraceae bacterium]|jgi:multiple sugar transport system permease protein|nr:sugar ABC transporter permease [Oscillospiraceae bacterium]